MLYDKIYALCKERKLSISELERRAELGKGTVHCWKTASPTIDNLKKVASVLEVNVAQLVE